MSSDSAGEPHDAALFEEIRLLGALVLGASDTTGRLTPHEVDEVPEVDVPEPGAAAAQHHDEGPIQ